MNFSEPNEYGPEIQSQFHDERGRAEIHGVIQEDESVVTLQESLIATDNDTVGGAGKSAMTHFLFDYLVCIFFCLRSNVVIVYFLYYLDSLKCEYTQN